MRWTMGGWSGGGLPLNVKRIRVLDARGKWLEVTSERESFGMDIVAAAHYIRIRRLDDLNVVAFKGR